MVIVNVIFVNHRTIFVDPEDAETRFQISWRVVKPNVKMGSIEFTSWFETVSVAFPKIRVVHKKTKKVWQHLYKDTTNKSSHWFVYTKRKELDIVKDLVYVRSVKREVGYYYPHHVVMEFQKPSDLVLFRMCWLD